jgi:hypothetical protein
MENLDFSTTCEDKGIVKDIVKKALPVLYPIIKEAYLIGISKI